MAISFFIAMMRTVSCVLSPNPIDGYICLMYSTALLMVLSEFINFFCCNLVSPVRPVCIATWVLFSLSLEWSLGALCTLAFFAWFIM